ncbi:aspartate:alanine exchanger family transporter [Allorhodopirellula solitaria]|uniref:Aspartate/alanine antiporter n=1 Tax=Allorhodopirellula solitaria TaxID=2527987 RepID=A0A5C5XYD7_9BACT|nr:TrkA C-terminal domain-containing protein [Allorhodopirellula solitaria]TWT67541.1 Aspartate/alanine antiporter [Allorhodopirellula solitaria]
MIQAIPLDLFCSSILIPLASVGLEGVFQFLGEQQWVFILVALAIGYPLGRIPFGPISLGSTASVLLVAVVLSMIAQVAYGLTYSIPGIVSTIFLTLFMYALGLGTGPKFFAGLKSSGLAAIVVGLIIWALNWCICFFGAELAGLDSGFAAGLISGSYTITAVLGVAQSAVQSGTATIPPGMTADQIGANMAAGYAISYLLSSVGIIVLLRYLPAMFGHDPVADAKRAEQDFSGSGTHPLPGTPQSLLLGHSSVDIRAYRVTHENLVGKTVNELFRAHPEAPILRLVRGDEIIDLAENPTLQIGDIVAARADIGDLILDGAQVGEEVDEDRARNIPIEAADIVVGQTDIAGRTIADLAGTELAYGLRVTAIFRAGQEIPLGPDTDLRHHDVIRLTGPESCIDRAAKTLGSRAITERNLATTEVTSLALAMTAGYIVGSLSVTVAGIPFALGTSAGCLLAGIVVAYLRSRNPSWGGPVSEGARSFLQDIGLNIFVAALGANVGPKIASALSGNTVIWLAIIGTTAALLPVVVAYFVGDRLLKMNSIINAGACAGGRNSTPALNAILDQSESQVAAVPFPVSYAVTTVLALVGGYIAQVLS